jgi:hypothetical protein
MITAAYCSLACAGVGIALILVALFGLARKVRP